MFTNILFSVPRTMLVSHNRGILSIIILFVAKTKKYLFTVILAYPKVCLLSQISLLHSSTNQGLICILHENFPSAYFTNLRMSNYVTQCCVQPVRVHWLSPCYRPFVFSLWLRMIFSRDRYETKCKSNSMLFVCDERFTLPLAEVTPKIIKILSGLKIVSV